MVSRSELDPATVLGDRCALVANHFSAITPNVTAAMAGHHRRGGAIWVFLVLDSNTSAGLSALVPLQQYGFQIRTTSCP